MDLGSFIFIGIVAAMMVYAVTIYNNLVRLTWPEPVFGRLHVTARVDRPI